MVTSMKNNSRRKRQSYFDSSGITLNENEKGNLIENQEPSEEQIEKIKVKLSEERKENFKRIVKLSAVSIGILIVGIYLIDYFFGDRIKEFIYNFLR